MYNIVTEYRNEQGELCKEISVVRTGLSAAIIGAKEAQQYYRNRNQSVGITLCDTYGRKIDTFHVWRLDNGKA